MSEINKAKSDLENAHNQVNNLYNQGLDKVENIEK